MFQPQQAAEFGSFGHVVLALESRIEEGSYGISLHDEGKSLRTGAWQGCTCVAPQRGHFVML